jgi:hypothetical protein
MVMGEPDLVTDATTPVASNWLRRVNGNQLWEDQFVDSTWATQLPGQLYEGDNATIMLTTRARNIDPSTGYIPGPLLQYSFTRAMNSIYSGRPRPTAAV